MDDVARTQFDLDVSVRWEVQGWCVDSGLFGPVEVDLLTTVVCVFGQVVEVPSPLLTNDFDLNLAWRVVIHGVFKRVDGCEEETNNQDDGEDGVHDFNRHVVLHLNRQAAIILATAVSDDAEQHEAPGDSTYGQQRDPTTVPQRDVVVGVASCTL